eukprot:GHRQ01034472.1.p1 GENE.GHRQ01034472.1~~GHRQ01034472.1.p1  ORF type:complete len:101 (-),score=57.02 GHRQ01034472.1:99-401(-)
MGDQWQIFLLQDKEEKPTAVLLPSAAREGVLSPVTEVWLAVVFGLLSIVSSLQASGIPLFQWLTNPFYTPVAQQVGQGWQAGAPVGDCPSTSSSSSSSSN